MQSTHPIDTVFRHNLWANLKLLEACGQLTGKQLQATIPGSRGTIQETLQHIATSERSYFSRISTGQPYRHPSDASPLTLQEISDSLQETGSGLVEWAPKVGAEDTVEIDWDGTPRDVPKAIILNQVVNHATEHREQVKATMTEIGVEPPDLSSWEYFDRTA